MCEWRVGALLRGGDDLFVLDATDRSGAAGLVYDIDGNLIELSETITDMCDEGDDTIDLTALDLFASPAEALALAMQNGNDITFDFDGDAHVDLVLKDTALGILTEDDFLV